MSPKVFRHVHRVTYADCTIGNHIYYARYLELLEPAKGGFFRSLGISQQSLSEQHTALPVTECQLGYKSPARHDDLLDIRVRLLECEGVRVGVAY